MKILIADDDELMLDMLEHTLERAGYEVEKATDGRRALEILERGDVRLVISDWEMPELSGIQLCEAIRGGMIDGYVYIILLTSHTGSEQLVEGMSAGADDFIAKPFNTAELLVRIRAGVRVLSLETREVAIFALAKLAESRDPETGHHLERVQCYSRVLAHKLGQQQKFKGEIDAEFIRLVYLTSPLHDIGKVGIPDSVLRKPGRLSDTEFKIMKTHARLGAETLDAALDQFPEARFLRVARDIAATHHERWDGSGYPYGLAGDEIPLCGRIVAVADVYDALTSKRCYKDAYAHHVARSIIAEEAGSHFDPDIVATFLECESEFVAIQERFAEGHHHIEPQELVGAG